MNDQCPQIILIDRRFYTFYNSKTEELKLETKSIRRFARKSNRNDTFSDSDAWIPVKRALTELERYYYTEESKMDRERRKPTFIMIGATGGLGVIVLAISIFWGLRTSDEVIGQ